MTILHTLGSVRAIDLDDAGRVWQSRAHPSAGGTHCIEPLVYVHDSTELQSGWYRQDGDTYGHLDTITIASSALQQAVLHATRRDTQPALTVFAIADPAIIAARYPTGSSLLWRDAGTFLMTAHLLATAFGHSSAILGISVPVYGSTPTPADQGAYAVGAVAIGGRLQQPVITADTEHGAASPRRTVATASSIKDTSS